MVPVYSPPQPREGNKMKIIIKIQYNKDNKTCPIYYCVIIT